MTELLAAARGQGLAEPWPQVTAFNVLRVAFGESSLAIPVSRHCAEGMLAYFAGPSALCSLCTSVSCWHADGFMQLPTRSLPFAGVKPCNGFAAGLTQTSNLISFRLSGV